MPQKYWLFKSEPSEFSIDDLKSAKGSITHWDGVRNYQARNFIRDEIKKGDKVLYYHSNSDPNAVVGTCEVVKDSYPDFTALDPKNPHFDPKSSKEETRWFMVDIKLIEKFKNPVVLSEIKSNPKLKNIRLVQRGNRLSVMPIEKEEYTEILKMSK